MFDYILYLTYLDFLFIKIFFFDFSNFFLKLKMLLLFDYIKIILTIISFILTFRIVFEACKHKTTKNFIFVINQLIRCLIKNIGYIIQSMDENKKIYIGGESKDLLCTIQSCIILYTSISIEIWIIAITMSTYCLITDKEYKFLNISFSFLIFDIPSIIILIIYYKMGSLGKAKYNCYIKTDEQEIIKYIPYFIELIIMIFYTIFVLLIIANIKKNNDSLINSNFFCTSTGKKVRKYFIYSLLLFPIIGFIGIIFPSIYRTLIDEPSPIQRNIFILIIMFINILYPLGTGFFSGLFNCSSENQINLNEEENNDDEEKEIYLTEH